MGIASYYNEQGLLMIMYLPLYFPFPALQPEQPAPHHPVEQPPSVLTKPEPPRDLPTHLAPATPDSLNSLTRLRLDPPSTSPVSTQNPAPLHQFATALIEQGDRELADGVVYSLIRRQCFIDTESPFRGNDEASVPPNSTFGKVWAKFVEAVRSEPFASYAKQHKLDLKDLSVHPNGTIANFHGKHPVILNANASAESTAATAAVIAAAKDLVGPNHDRLDGIMFYDDAFTSNATVAQFYGLSWDTVNSDAILSTLGNLSREGTFPSLNSTDPANEPLKQRQKAAIQHILDLPQQELNELLALFKPASGYMGILYADEALAALCSQALLKMIPGTGEHDSPGVLKDIPEYSSFSLARKNLLQALTSTAFTAFAQQNNLDPASIRINPGTGVLTGKVGSADTTFTQTDDSGWSDVWPTISEDVQRMGIGSDSDVTYPSSAPASLVDVMTFYEKSMPDQYSPATDNWQQKNRESILIKLIELNSGFPGTFRRYPDFMLEDAPPSQLQTLAARVQQSPDPQQQVALR